MGSNEVKWGQIHSYDRSLFLLKHQKVFDMWLRFGQPDGPPRHLMIHTMV